MDDHEEARNGDVDENEDTSSTCTVGSKRGIDTSDNSATPGKQSFTSHASTSTGQINLIGSR